MPEKQSTTPITVLVVEDDRALADRICTTLDSLGWSHRHADTVRAAREVLARESIHILYLDRMLADGEDGLQLLTWLRSIEGAMPGVLVASRLATPEDHVEGLDQGADDYIDKPFDAEELRSRFRALARRLTLQRSPPSVIVWGDLEIRTASRVALWQGRPLEMMPLTLRLLETLASQRGEWVSRRALWLAAWPDQARVAPRDYVINVAMSRLREVLASCDPGPRVETGERLGYRLVVPG